MELIYHFRLPDT